jgi:hypothetical protein
MPVQAFGHQQFWRARANVPPEPSATGPDWPYPRWQTTIVAGSLLGGWADLARSYWRWLVAVWRYGRRAARLPSLEQAVADRVLDALASHRFRHAYQAVREVALTRHFNRTESWLPLSRELKAARGPAENTFRHLAACHGLEARLDERLSNPEKHLLVELAYHAYAVDPHADV